MKKLFILVIALAAVLGACKTNEANYRAAYEKAKERRTETGDSLTTSQLRSSLLPKDMVIGSDTLPVMTFPVSVYSDKNDKNNVPVGELKKYLIVVGQFRQIFNAGSMARRIADNGLEGAFVVYNRQKDYFVIAASTDNPDEVVGLLNGVRSDRSLSLRSPYPYVLRPAQFVR